MRKISISLMMALCFCAFTNKAMGQTWNISDNSTSGNNVSATLSGSTLTISGTGNMADFWDSSAGEAPWYSVRTNIQTVTIQNGVANIGNRAFHDCINLRTINNIPPSVTIIGRQSFFNCTNPNFTAITIPATINEIEGEAFLNCSNLKTVTLENGNSQLNFTSFYYSGTEYARGSKYDWFSGCPVQTLHLGRNLSANYWVFNDIKTTLQSLTIGNTVTSVPNTSFQSSIKLKTVTIQDGTTILVFSGNTNNPCFYNCPIETLYLGRNLNCPGYSNAPFMSNISLKNLTIGNSVTSIPTYLFYECSGLQSLTLGNSITSIEARAFSGCINLTSALNFPNSLTTIGDYAFYGCENVPSVFIPASVATIANSAFINCKKLKTVTIQDGTTILVFSGNTNNPCFYNCPIETLYLGRNLNCPGYSNAPFMSNISLKNLTIGSSVTSIGDYLFYHCTGLQSITNNRTAPQSINANVFSGVTLCNVRLTVPASSLQTYKTANVWKDFYCTGGVNDCVAASLTVSPENYNFPASGGEKTVDVTYDAECDVFVSSGDESWLNIPQEGNKVGHVRRSPSISDNGTFTMEAAQNYSTSPRNTTVTVSGGGITRTIYVTQDGAGTSGINDVENSKINIYPNPAQDEIFIQSENEIEKIEIVDINGRTVGAYGIRPNDIRPQNQGECNSPLQNINISALPAGVYFVRMTIDKQLVTKKLVKE
ncbi:MAG: leucine-rich repeat protein [Prevotellaceae bacterium]|jgi:hypothetical protein|nr:leucine-rich repeat protein [Prevotellaceae bacterium]